MKAELNGYLWDYVQVEYVKKYREKLEVDWPQQAITRGVRGLMIDKLYDGRYSIRIPPALPQVNIFLFFFDF